MTCPVVAVDDVENIHGSVITCHESASINVCISTIKFILII